jgi:ribonuclease E
MTTRMLIDARHREETRVAVIKGNRIEEFDFESAEHKQLKGNIYLAKVTRVEPSLQAAFIEYGGNRHGFLAFSEIHPDYYQIPREDREALLREEREAAAADAAMRAEEDLEELEGEIEDVQPPAPLDDDDHADHDEDAVDVDGDDADGDGDAETESSDDRPRRDGGRGRGRRRRRGGGRDREQNDEEALDRRPLRRRYKIQDVIKRRQVMLVQVVKEERGNKGAALTTYLSLAGRYCVLMPNSSHGGGISRKISSSADRKRLKSVIDELGLPTSMGCIVRTAGLERTKTEIKRDFDYLARLWDEIREKTLHSEAPALIHSDSDLIKRAIRDIYNSGIEDVLVEGDEGYRAAKDFMKLLMPSHARRVKQYADPVPLFQRYGVEDQLGAMYQPVVNLKSGGYLVINPTEALVSIDINSGRSTREHNIEQTATSTNLEAAYEIARQLRLRDMAGLVVIDFIDMDMNSNVRKVERAMKDALKNDRARIQVGRISGFGLMEMSRQRLRTGVLEASTRACPHCEGTGLVRTASSAGLSALRLLEEEAARGKGSRLILRASQEASFYVLNNKRAELSEIEGRYGVRIEVLSDGETEGARMTVEVSGPPPEHVPTFAPIIDEDEDEDLPDFADDEDEEDELRREGRGDRDRDSDGKRRRRGRRRRGGRRDEGDREESGAERSDTDGAGEAAGDRDPADDDRGENGDRDGRRRRRGRRGGRGRNGAGAETTIDAGAEGGEDETVTAEVAEAPPVAEAEAPAKPKRRSRKAAAEEAVPVEAVAATVEPEPEAEAPAKPKRRTRKAAAAEDAPAEAPVAEAKPKRARSRKAADLETAEAAAEPAPASADGAEPRPRRTGWWQRTFGGAEG